MRRLSALHENVRFLANSRAVAQDFRKLSSRADVRVLYNGIDVERFAPGQGDPDWLAGEARLAPPPADCVCFGLVGTYAHWKGHVLFIQAAGALRSRRPDLRLRFYIVGGPIYATQGSQVSVNELLECSARVGVSDCLGFVPFQAEMPRVYRSLNVVVHASTKPEPFGLVIVEAMACGLPVIVSNAGGAAELFQHGENALGFALGDSLALAAQMERLAVDAELRRALGAHARVHAGAHFALDRLGKELAAAYDT
ncbi:MAG TPA: glycosyltransferase family 4 protein [Polyangiaceae bacterium]